MSEKPILSYAYEIVDGRVGARPEHIPGVLGYIDLWPDGVALIATPNSVFFPDMDDSEESETFVVDPEQEKVLFHFPEGTVTLIRLRMSNWVDVAPFVPFRIPEHIQTDDALNSYCFEWLKENAQPYMEA